MSTIHAADRTITTVNRIAGFLKPKKNGNPILELAKTGVLAALKGESIDVEQLTKDLAVLHKPLAPLAKIPEAPANAFEQFIKTAKPHASPSIRRLIDQFKTLKQEQLDFIAEQLDAMQQGSLNFFSLMSNPKFNELKDFALKLLPDLKKLKAAIKYSWGDDAVNKAFGQSLLNQLFPAKA